MLDSKILEKLDTLHLSSKFAIKNFNTGKRKSSHKGESLEFSDYKKYNPGDDFRKIDWNLFARFKKLYTKEFLEERCIVINIFLDNSKSMEFYDIKSQISKKIALIFSYIGVKNLDKVNFYITKKDELKLLFSLDNQLNFINLNNSIDELDVSESNIFSLIPKYDFKKGISIIISDFLDKDVLKSIKYLGYKKQEINLIQTLEEKEINPKLEGDLKLIDSEYSFDKDVSINKRVIEEYKINLDNHIEKIKTEVHKFRGFHQVVNVNDSIEEIIFNQLIRKNILR